MITLLIKSVVIPSVLLQGGDSTHNPIIDSLKTGGYVIVFRHAHTDRSKMEQSGWSLADRSTQRNLSEQGMEESHAIGRAFKLAGIPVGEVLASPMFRTYETAEHAFGRADTTELLRQQGRSPEARQLLTREVQQGTNRVLVTHNAYFHQNLDAAGYAQNGEGDAVVVRPRGEAGFEVLGRLRLSELIRVATPERK